MKTLSDIRTYARKVTLRNGDAISIRHLQPDDRAALEDFFLHIPEDDRFFLRDDVASPGVVRGWIENMDHSRAIPLVATKGEQIVGEGAVISRKGPARSHVAEIRLVVAPTWRQQGVGTELIRSLCEAASHAGFSAVLFEVAEYGQREAIEAAEEMGFIQIGRLEGGACDRDGHLHDLVTLAMPLVGYWAQF
jgi:L-amino acid N-acyltransferase YncA